MDVRKVYQFHELLRGRKTVISMAGIVRQLEFSESTVKRVMQFMRDYLYAPLVFDREYGGYRYTDESYELPGLWFSGDEMLALLTMQKLLAELGPGLLDQQLAPLLPRIKKMLSAEYSGNSQTHRIRLLPIASRTPDSKAFQTIAGALLRRRRLRIDYHARGSDKKLLREVSPQRLAHYRDNWYLDAWCHEREALRTFALDCMHRVCTLDTVAEDVPEEQLNAHYAAGYGIFAGASQHTAVLRFTPERARWVAAECWHPQQQSKWLQNGRYELHIPYADPRELVMDILRYVPDVEVVAPEALRQELRSRLKAGLKSME